MSTHIDVETVTDLREIAVDVVNLAVTQEGEPLAGMTDGESRIRNLANELSSEVHAYTSTQDPSRIRAMINVLRHLAANCLRLIRVLNGRLK